MPSARRSPSYLHLAPVPAEPAGAAVRAGQPDGRRPLRYIWLALAASAAAAICGLWLAQPTSWQLWSPGPVVNLDSAIRGQVTDAGFGHQGHLLMLSVETSDITRADVIWDGLTGQSHAGWIAAANATTSSGDDAAAMVEAKTGAWAVAATILNAERPGLAGATPISYDTGSITGPSAGMMMTLADIDARSPGSLTAGRVVAGTGTIAGDGSVGPIGGARFKFQAALKAGATVFFVPQDNFSEVPAPPPGVKVVPVGDVDDALRWLCANGAADQVCATIPGTFQQADSAHTDIAQPHPAAACNDDFACNPWAPDDAALADGLTPGSH